MYDDGGVSAGAMVGVAAIVCLMGGLIAGMIAYTKNKTTGTFVGFFIFGALLPIIGIIAAALAKPATPAGWYPDPWQQASYRWHDGTNWTGQTG